MTIEELARLGRDMRAKQKDYFRTRDQGTLRESKDMERRFDAAVKSVLDPPNPGLFGRPATIPGLLPSTGVGSAAGAAT